MLTPIITRATFAIRIRLLGVPAYGIGSIGGNFYGPNEWVDVDDLVRLVAVLIQTMSGWSALTA